MAEPDSVLCGLWRAPVKRGCRPLIVGWRMTESEAAAWAKSEACEIHKVEGSAEKHSHGAAVPSNPRDEPRPPTWKDCANRRSRSRRGSLPRGT